MKCFYHDDLDGRCSAHLVAKYEKEDYNESDFIEVNYVKELPYDIIKKDELVYFVDYSFTKKTINRLRKVMEITKNIIWIDHHKDSVKVLEENPDIKSDIKAIVMDGKISGAGLVWMYFNYENNLDLAPKYIKLVSDYDCWVLDNKEAMQFKLYADSVDHNPFAKIWNRASDELYLDNMINDGKVIQRFITNEYKEYIDKYAFETELEGYRVLACNRRNNSLLFGDKINEYDIICPFIYNNGVYVYSLFTNKDNIYCNEIANKFGGGGHHQAAGFSTKELIFKK